MTSSTAPRSALPAWLDQLLAELQTNRRKAFLLGALLVVFIVVWINVLLGTSPRKRRVPANQPPPTVPTGLALPEPMGGVNVTRSHVNVPELLARFKESWRPRWRPVEGERPFGNAIGVARSETTVREDTAHASPSPKSGDSVEPPTELPEQVLEQQALQALVPTATFLSKRRGNLVRIGGRLYRQGERIGSFVLAEIRVREIVLQGRHGSYQVGIPQHSGGH